MTTSPRRLAFLALAVAAIATGAVWLTLGRGWRGGARSAEPSDSAARVEEPQDGSAPRLVEVGRDEPLDTALPSHDGLVPADPKIPPPPPTVPTCAISGRLVDPGGAAIGGIPVHCNRVRMPASHADESVDSAMTDPLGTFAFRVGERTNAMLSYGDARIPLPHGDSVAVTDADVDLGGIALPALGSVEVEVLDNAKRPVPDASVRASLNASSGSALATDAFGRATARHLPPGSYRFFATHPTAGRGNAPINLAAGARETLKIELRTAP
jgi:hypothetical protein